MFFKLFFIVEKILKNTQFWYKMILQVDQWSYWGWIKVDLITETNRSQIDSSANGQFGHYISPPATLRWKCAVKKEIFVYTLKSSDYNWWLDILILQRTTRCIPTQGWYRQSPDVQARFGDTFPRKTRYMQGDQRLCIALCAVVRSELLRFAWACSPTFNLLPLKTTTQCHEALLCIRVECHVAKHGHRIISSVFWWDMHKMIAHLKYFWINSIGKRSFLNLLWKTHF